MLRSRYELASKEVAMSPKQREPRNISELDETSFGAQLRRLRVAAGLSQAELGEAIGADQPRISAWEVGKYMPSEVNVLDLARALNVKPGLLLEGSQWGGALVVGSERRKRLQQLQEEDWQILDALVDVLGAADSQKRTILGQRVREIVEAFPG